MSGADEGAIPTEPMPDEETTVPIVIRVDVTVAREIVWPRDEEESE